MGHGPGMQVKRIATMAAELCGVPSLSPVGRSKIFDEGRFLVRTEPFAKLCCCALVQPPPKVCPCGICRGSGMVLGYPGML